ncbi:transferase C1orf69 like protein, mitochondrial [Trypanosoma theileri]|uniref:Transferase C1orf69 like protein, mitochondrial n=1 Tax=Trypanosoma theileri TaxID=67003 RepID=A0A1X0NVS6_9TRYP|nr:transferase C1orf69 like protein, mitochondrial [Trypanosoma theileri]ORC88816.1 transferase C1orf69 like protein, mitochondrial [Trypanosoma theileri]
MGFNCLLPSRSLIRISGVVSHEFLQGLFTNDLRLLLPGGSIWGCFLYHTGRVMCDAYLYQPTVVKDNGQTSIIVDVHSDMVNRLQEHLLEMRMRKKLQIENISKDFTILASTGPSCSSSSSSCSCSSSSGNDCGMETYVDPRSFALPTPLHKSILPTAEIPTKTTTTTTTTRERDPEGNYHKFLYSAGVGEGPDVFRHAKTLPFEANTDFLRGVSFHKGCYIGQELTHRTHVMLVTRKRTVPFQLRQSAGRVVSKGEALFADGQKVGEVLTSCGDVGLALLRLRCLREDPQLLLLQDGVAVEVRIPKWWDAREVRKIMSMTTTTTSSSQG